MRLSPLVAGVLVLCAWGGAPVSAQTVEPSRADAGVAPASRVLSTPLAAPASPSAKHKSPSADEALPIDPEPTFGPGTLSTTSDAAKRYADIVARGGWPTDLVALNARSVGPDVARLRRRLAIEGDLPADEPLQGPEAQIWDDRLTKALKRFQSRTGLKPNGVLSGDTLKEINTPAEVRAQALAASAQRMSEFNFGFGERYVVVNLPSTSVEAIENGRVAHRYVAIVGDPNHPSPQIAAHISEVTLNPTWTVPVSIIKKEIIPRMKRDPGYLAREKIRILDGYGAEIDPRSIDWSTNRAVNYTLRQDSGAANSLGVLRVDMPNKEAVYMHDTPSKRLFGADYRFLSHGCVRVQGVFDYAEWLLQGSPNPDGEAWDSAALHTKQKDGERLDIKVVKPTPVIWLYLTGWATGDGVVHFRRDVYGLDASGQQEAVNAIAAAVSSPARAPIPSR